MGDDYIRGKETT